MRQLMIVSVLALGACASAQGSGAESSRDCFRAASVSGYGVVDERRIRVSVSPTRDYILTIGNNTANLDWNHAISIDSPSPFVCVGSGNGVILRGGDPPVSHFVTQIERAPAQPARS